MHLTVFRRNGRDQKQEKPQVMWGKRHLSETVLTLVPHIEYGYPVCYARPYLGVLGYGEDWLTTFCTTGSKH